MTGRRVTKARREVVDPGMRKCKQCEKVEPLDAYPMYGRNKKKTICAECHERNLAQKVPVARKSQGAILMEKLEEIARDRDMIVRIADNMEVIREGCDAVLEAVNIIKQDQMDIREAIAKREEADKKLLEEMCKISPVLATQVRLALEDWMKIAGNQGGVMSPGASGISSPNIRSGTATPNPEKEPELKSIYAKEVVDVDYIESLSDEQLKKDLNSINSARNNHRKKGHMTIVETLTNNYNNLADERDRRRGK